MWELYKPTVEKIELDREEQKRQKAMDPQEPPAPQLSGLPQDTDSLLNDQYFESDPGKQLRDGLLWTAFEWMRVIRDTDDGPVADISAASSPPPNAFSLFVMSTYALSPVEKRRDLISRAMAFATRSHDIPPPGRDENQDTDSFMDKIS